ncbi:DNA breaking-rejoining protein [Acinetobacter johnsonii]|nr:DNA breaking-rejoining protein [Acinetobacter johnsonii]
MKKITLVGSIILVLSTAALNVFAAPVKPIQFAKGAIGTTVAGSFKGYDDVQYSLRAKAGQTLNYKLTSNGNLAQINIYAPGDIPGAAEALVIGSATGTAGQLKLPESGNYLIQIYQMRNTARNNRTVNYKLHMGVDR